MHKTFPHVQIKNVMVTSSGGAADLLSADVLDVVGGMILCIGTGVTGTVNKCVTKYFTLAR
jgi:hypothetical protein